MNDDKFICYGTFDKKFNCLIKCPFKKECESYTIIRKAQKEIKNEKTEQR